MKDSSILKELGRDKDGRILLDSLVPGVDYVIKEEEKGKRDKVWIVFSDKKFLVKRVGQNTYEDYIEMLVEQLCMQMGMPTAHYDLAMFEGYKCVITEDFRKSEAEEPLTGVAFMSTTIKILIDNGLVYRDKESQDQKELNNLEMIRKCLSIYLSPEQLEEEMKMFDMLFALSCFCQNGDLHLGNWSVIHNAKSDRLYSVAPNYDFGSYFHCNLTKSKIRDKLNYLSKQARTEKVGRILDYELFGKDFNRHNSLNYSYEGTEELGFSRLEEICRKDPGRFAYILRKLFELDPDAAITNVKAKIGNAPIPEECLEWFRLVIMWNKERLEKLMNEVFVDERGNDSYGI